MRRHSPDFRRPIEEAVRRPVQTSRRSLSRFSPSAESSGRKYVQQRSRLVEAEARIGDAPAALQRRERTPVDVLTTREEIALDHHPAQGTLAGFATPGNISCYGRLAQRVLAAVCMTRIDDERRERPADFMCSTARATDAAS